MATIYNSELFKEIKDGARIQQMVDSVPSQLQNTVIPVMEVNPKLLRRCNFSNRINLSNATSATITSATDKDTYIVAATIAFIKDATSTSANINLNVRIDGVAHYIFQIPCITLTAQNGSNSVTFPFPLKIDRGSVITVASSTNVANILVSATITGYTVDNPNA